MVARVTKEFWGVFYCMLCITYVFQSHFAATEIKRESIIFTVDLVLTQQHGTEDDRMDMFRCRMGFPTFVVETQGQWFLPDHKRVLDFFKKRAFMNDIKI